MSPSPFLDPFHPYELSQPIGKGEMGSVFQARDIETGQVVAFKLLEQFDLRSKVDRGAVLEIIEFAARFKHPQLHPILKAMESDEDNGKIAIAMPIASARSLADFLNAGKKIPAKHAINIIIKLGGALEFLHKQDVAYGGVKPSNVLLDKDANPTLTDLPMAHLREFGLLPAQPSVMQQYYLPPEVLYNSPPEIRGDIFSLGVLGYHLFKGTIPFDDPEPEARHKLPESVGLPIMLYYVLLRAMTHRTEMRYPTVAAFLEDLQGAMNGKIDPNTLRWFKVKEEKPPDGDPPRR